jgi:CysZ protein
MSSFFQGFTAFFRGMGFSISRLGVWYLVPLVLWLLLVVGLSFQISEWLIPYLYRWIEAQTGLNLSGSQSENAWQEILKTGLKWAVIIVVKILLWYAMSRYMKYIVLILLSPLFAYISEKTEEIITGNNYPFNMGQFLKDVLRGMGITLRNMFLETLLILAGGILTFFIPVLSPLVLLALFLVNSYFMAFNFFDYAVERKKMGVSKSVMYMRANRTTLLGSPFWTGYWLPSALLQERFWPIMNCRRAKVLPHLTDSRQTSFIRAVLWPNLCIFAVRGKNYIYNETFSHIDFGFNPCSSGCCTACQCGSV